MLLNGAQILVESLVEQGVETVFGYPGGSVLDIYDQLYKNSHRINHVISAHEQGAAHAADGYARVSGRTGVVIATSGPGATNLVTGIANAYLDSVPMVAITGNVASHLLGKDSFQEVDIVGITQPIVKHSYLVKDVKKLSQTIKEAFIIASTGRKGPVLIDIPKSVQKDVCEYISKPVTVKQHNVAFDNDFDAALQAIKQSKKPYIYCGGGVIAAEAEAEVLELSKKLSAPIGLSMMGLTAIPADYELNLGMCGMHGKYASSVAQSEADLVIAVGVRFSDRATGNVDKYSEKCTIIHIDVDAAEIGKNIRKKIGLCGDVKEILNFILPSISSFKNEEWLARIEENKKADKTENDGSFTPRNIISTVQSFCDNDTVIATDVGQHQMWTVQYYQFKKSRTLLTSGGLGTMGYGLGASIGGCIANNKKTTVLFTSDGSFGMNLNELATAVSQKLPIFVIILNNGVLGMVRQWQNAFYEERYSQTTLNRQTDFPMLAKAFGGNGYSATTLEELSDILRNSNNLCAPCIIDCKIDMDEKVLPMIPPGGCINDIILE
ncbi:MAG: biosynthetic-type acetolactate synthase large subunit [Bacillota bacterium]|nr:biosynthetic-type acetolactate synthase large subunit [Bacillota bacterium]